MGVGVGSVATASLLESCGEGTCGSVLVMLGSCPKVERTSCPARRACQLGPLGTEMAEERPNISLDPDSASLELAAPVSMDEWTLRRFNDRDGPFSAFFQYLNGL
jgi:hypothetical protein